MNQVPTLPFQLTPLTIEHGKQLCAWRYEPPYDLYNWPDWDTLVARQEEFADPDIRQLQYAALLDDSGMLCGFAQFFPLVGVTRLGLGLRPDLCGRGFGVAAVQAIVAEARRRRPTDEIDLEVMTWNERARRTYERAGFAATDRYERPTPTGPGEFWCMVWKNETP